jgi:hypothetical protein
MILLERSMKKFSRGKEMVSIYGRTETGGGFDEYATYESMSKDPDETYAGHYFSTLTQAVEDYNERISENVPRN